MNNLNLLPTAVRLKYLEQKLGEFVKEYSLTIGNELDVPTFRKEMELKMEQFIIEEDLRVSTEDIKELLDQELIHKMMSELSSQHPNCAFVRLSVSLDGGKDTIKVHFHNDDAPLVQQPETGPQND